MDINSVTISGRLTRDAELKYTPTGMALAKFSLAVGNKTKKEGQWVDDTIFLDVTAWGKTAENLAKYLVKGKQIAVCGRLHVDKWEKDGVKHTRVGINADDIALFGGGEVTKSDTKPAPVADNYEKKEKKEAPESGDFADDIPF